MARLVSPVATQNESAVRTLVDLAVGAGLTWLTGWVVQKGADNDIVFDNKQVSLLLWGGYTIIAAWIKRRLWPTQTDKAGVGRTDQPVA